MTQARVPPLLANAGFYKVSFINSFRIEISDHGASEGSDDTLPNETTVKFINEVSSKVSHYFTSLKRPSIMVKKVLLKLSAYEVLDLSYCNESN